jgi:nitrogen fixation-related uncharacterized protein
MREAVAFHEPDGGDAEAPEAGRRIDFLVAASGGRGLAIALLLGPTAIGLLLGLLAFLLGLGSGAFEDVLGVSQEVLRDPTCSLLLRNLALFCLFLGPAAAAALLVARWPKAVRAFAGDPPAVDRPYWFAAAAGGLAIAIAGPHFYLFGALSQAACRLTEVGNAGGLLAAGGIVALLSPLATTAAVTAAHALLRYEHGQGPLRALPAHLPVGNERAYMKRTGIALLSLGLVVFGYVVGSLQGDNTVLLGAEALIVTVGVLLVKGNLAAARFASWCIAFVAPTLIAGMLLPPLLQPFALTISQWQHHPFPMLGLVAFNLAFLAGTYWVYRRLRAPLILAARAALGRATVAPWTGLVVGAVFLLVAFYAGHRQLDAFDVLHARELAVAQYGKDIAYQVERLRYQDGDVYADITAYGGDDLFSFQISWKPKAPGG